MMNLRFGVSALVFGIVCVTASSLPVSATTTFESFGQDTLHFLERDVEIECELSPTQSSTVERILLFSLQDEVKIIFRNGGMETRKPVAAKSRGLFGDQDFSSDLVWNNGQVFVPGTRAGDLYVRFACFFTPTIPFERCISQGSGKPAEFAGVELNLGGKVVKFFGRNICTRTDRGAPGN